MGPRAPGASRPLRTPPHPVRRTSCTLAPRTSSEATVGHIRRVGAAVDSAALDPVLSGRPQARPRPLGGLPSGPVVGDTAWVPRHDKCCERCGAAFVTYDAAARFCSRACMFAAKTADHVERTCHHCHGTFKISPNRVAAGGGRYCSKACKDDARRPQTRQCATCGKRFAPHPSRLSQDEVYCSRNCAGVARRSRVAKVCAECGVTFEIGTARAAAGRGVYCSVACSRPGPIERICERCGAEFTASRSEVAKGWGRFCSNQCRRTRVERACQTCGHVFEVEAAVAGRGGNYCSVECRGLGMRNRVIRECAQCGVDFERPASVAAVFCSRECNTKARRNDPIEVERVRQMQRDHLASRAPTRCERVLYLVMDEVFGEGNWASQFLVEDKWTVDACVPSLRLIVQADGDYWHGLLPEHQSHPTVQKNLANDRRQNSYLAKAGWRVKRFWEHSLLGEPAAVATILTALRDELGATGATASGLAPPSSEDAPNAPVLPAASVPLDHLSSE